MGAFDHIKTILGIILGLSITHLLKGIIKFVQHPKLTKPYWVHLIWCVYVLLLIMHFWWWESHLRLITHWNFELYFFLFFYISVYYFVCSLLLPDHLEEYKSYFTYYYSRRKWIFGALGLTYMLDFIDTLVKGKAYYLTHYDWEYPARNISHIILCICLMYSTNRKFHAVLAVAFFVYELTYIYRLFLYY
ncbi:hypothetical protein [Mucilaginibacter agri]|uniref:Uncharacterized protein n=1 Tax=Mucilaginibacter agri TaxID=2695265 RepID=A0A965ZJH0_9SPHI|nr:hypothetical protein [Mucilaginibacter agri]NCD70776.1 hypothetical protein [Mucilaginibacter agri]